MVSHQQSLTPLDFCQAEDTPLLAPLSLSQHHPTGNVNTPSPAYLSLPTRGRGMRPGHMLPSTAITQTLRPAPALLLQCTQAHPRQRLWSTNLSEFPSDYVQVFMEPLVGGVIKGEVLQQCDQRLHHLHLPAAMHGGERLSPKALLHPSSHLRAVGRLSCLSAPGSAGLHLL